MDRPFCPFSTVSEGIWLRGKALDCRPRDCEFDPLSLQLKLLNGDMYWLFPGKMLPCIKNLVCHVWWALQYLALWATNRN